MNYFSKPRDKASRMIFFLLALLAVIRVSGQISVTTLPYSPAVTNFDLYNPNNAANLAATIPSGWTASSTGSQVYNGQGTGSSATGGYWSYGTAAEFSLGALRSATPGNITYTVSYVNNSGFTITSIDLAWSYEQWRYANTSGWNCTGTGALSSNATLNSKDFAGVAAGTNGTVTNTPVPLFTLSGLVIPNGTAFGITWTTTDITNADNGISIDNFSISACGGVEITMGPNVTICNGAVNVALTYSNIIGGANQYSIDYDAATNSAGFVDVVNQSIPGGGNPFVLVIPAAAPPAVYHGTLTVRNSSTGCVSTQHAIVVHSIGCAASPNMSWVPLTAGSVHQMCTSTTDCVPPGDNTVCYGLQYIPDHSGLLTSYTTGFFVQCSSLGNPVISNSSCIMGDNSVVQDGCATPSHVILMNNSGNSGSEPKAHVYRKVPYIVHQVCLTIPSGETLNITEDDFTDLTTSIDGTPPVTEQPSYTTYSANSDVQCGALPLRWLTFQAKHIEELMSQLDWTTAEEINNSYFEVQRSNDNGRHFQTIGRVEATERSENVNSYQFIDRNAMTGINYYRLKQVDRDGQYDFSPIRNVEFSSTTFNVRAWPNPASTDITITIDKAEDAGRLVLVDMTGKKVFETQFDAGFSDHDINVSNIQPGMYTLVVNSGEKNLVEKIVIMH